jgi:hypothetical protein
MLSAGISHNDASPILDGTRVNAPAEALNNTKHILIVRRVKQIADVWVF